MFTQLSADVGHLRFLRWNLPNRCDDAVRGLVFGKTSKEASFGLGTRACKNAWALWPARPFLSLVGWTDVPAGHTACFPGSGTLSPAARRPAAPSSLPAARLLTHPICRPPCPETSPPKGPGTLWGHYSTPHSVFIATMASYKINQ